MVGGGSKSNFWGNLIASILNKPIIIGEDSELGSALGVARLAMLATNDYKQAEVIKSMKIINESSISNNLSERLDKRYKIWKEIVNVNLPISKKLMEK